MAAGSRAVRNDEGSFRNTDDRLHPLQRFQLPLLLRDRRFWRDGEDLSEPDVLAAAASSGTGEGAGDGGPDGEATAREWQHEWERLGVGGVPLLVAADGRHIYGLSDAGELARFLEANEDRT